MNMTAEEIARFMGKTKKSGDCLLWSGPLDKDGYGSFYFRRANRRAQRVSWFMHHGDVEAEMVVSPFCGNRNCVNHQHLRVVSKSDHPMNGGSSICYVNSQKTHCPKGHTYDREYSGQRYCSICDAEKKRRLREKWALQDTLNI